jgi:glycosyltransferase involved in cell wall biosynthesis
VVLIPARPGAAGRLDLALDALHHTATPVRAAVLLDQARPAELAAARELVAARGLSQRVEVHPAGEAPISGRPVASVLLPLDGDEPGAAIDSLAAGIPPVAAEDAGAAAELVQDGINGLRRLPDPRALAEGLDRLLSDRPLAERLAAAGRELQHTDWDGVVDRLLA